MPEYLPKMFIALEDERFYSHKGVDLKRTVGATIGFVFGRGIKFPNISNKQRKKDRN